MHEYSVVQAMFDQIEAIARAHHARLVRRVRVKIGEFAGVDPALFATAYDMCRVDTPCADAELQVDYVPASEELLLDQLELELEVP